LISNKISLIAKNKSNVVKGDVPKLVEKNLAITEATAK
jgi:hypothetical protein